MSKANQRSMPFKGALYAHDKPLRGNVPLTG